MKLKQLASSLLLGLGLAAAAAPAHSLALWSFEDDDIDFILDSNLNVRSSGTLAVGDVFVSVFEVPEFRINGSNAIPANSEVTGVAAVQLTAIIGTGGAGTQYIFSAYTGGLNSVLALGTDPDAAVVGGAAGQGAAIAFFVNSTTGAGGDIDLVLNRTVNPATNCTSLADCIDQASRGSLLQVDGFRGDPDEFWVASQILPGGNDIATVAGASNTALIAGVNVALSNFFNTAEPVLFTNIANGALCANPNPGYIADGCVQFVGSGTITGGAGLSNGAIAHSDFDAAKFVPEPGTLALIGVSLLGFGALRRRQRA